MNLNGVIRDEIVLDEKDNVLVLGSEVRFEGGVIRYESNNNSILRICGGGCESETLEYGEGGTNIIAGDYQIFYGLENIQFCGKWNITGVVYASWFGLEDTNALLIPENIQRGVDGRLNNDTKDDIDDIDVKDNSIAINTAIKLKGMGEVRLPQGTFCIKNHIRVTSGIQLIGVGPDIEGSTRGTVLYPYYNGENSSYELAVSKVNQESNQESKIKLSEIPFPLHTEPYSQDSAELEKIETGYMIVANICDEIKVDAIRDDNSNIIGISYFHNVIEKPTRPRVTRISGIDLVYWESIYKYIDNLNTVPAPALRHHYKGILFEGKIEIDNVRSFGLTQLCSNAYIGYSDNRYVHDNTFSLGVNQEYALGFPKPIYGFDLIGLGDALRFCGNHAASYHNMIGSLRIDQCKGGVIQSNILNSDVMINRSQGITYNGNHSEYGIKLDIRGSSITVCDNVFWKGTHPNIRIRRVEYPRNNNRQVVTLRNNTFSYFMKNLPATSNNMADVCDYDVVTDGCANIIIENCYRSRYYNDLNELEPTGITIGLLTVVEETQVLEPYYYDTNEADDFPAFNNNSHINSVRCTICGTQVSSYNDYVCSALNVPITLSEKSSIIENTEEEVMRYFLNKNGVTVEYEIYEIYDVGRNLGVKIGNHSITLTMDKSIVNIHLSAEFTDMQENKMLLIKRKLEQEIFTVLIPICGATTLTDDYISINGYKTPVTCIDISALCGTNVRRKGRNVECMINGSLPSGTAWEEGDVVWLDSGQCYVKHDEGWYLFRSEFV